MGVTITVLDVLLLLVIIKFGFRKIEAIVGVLILQFFLSLYLKFTLLLQNGVLF